MKIRLCIPEENKIWLECNVEEAEKYIYPLLDEPNIQLSKLNREKNIEIKGILDDFMLECFLVSHDLSEIIPFPAIYPHHPMWNAYSPFREMNEVNISNINEINNLSLGEI